MNDSAIVAGVEFIDVLKFPRVDPALVLLRGVNYEPSKQRAETMLPPEEIDNLVSTVVQHVREAFTLVGFPQWFEVEIVCRPDYGPYARLVLNQYLEQDLFNALMHRFVRLPDLRPIGGYVSLRLEFIIYSDKFTIHLPEQDQPNQPL